MNNHSYPPTRCLGCGCTAQDVLNARDNVVETLTADRDGWKNAYNNLMDLNHKKDEQRTALLKVYGVAKSVLHKARKQSCMVNGCYFYEISEALIENFKKTTKELEALDDADAKTCPACGFFMSHSSVCK